jgi:hypothetical protein
VTVEELEAAWRAGTPSPRGRGTVRLICVRRGGGMHDCPERAEVHVDSGLVGR